MFYSNYKLYKRETDLFLREDEQLLRKKTQKVQQNRTAITNLIFVN